MSKFAPMNVRALLSIAMERRPVNGLSQSHIEEIWHFLSRFQDSDIEHFTESLNKHSEALLFRLRDTGALVGFVSIDVIHAPLEGRWATLIFTSNVAIDDAYRGLSLVHVSGFRTYLRTRLRYPTRQVFFFFDSFSFKSYVMIGRNFVEYWPRPDKATPERLRSFLNEVAAKHYGEAFDPARGVVRASSRKRLKSGIAPIRPAELEDPLIRFFATRNPGHADGDMLVFLAPLSLANWLSAATHSLRKLVR